jgi:hypothetical protein
VSPSVSSGCRRTTGRNDQHVVGEDAAVVEQQFVALDPDLLDRVLVEDDAVAQLPTARPHDLLDLRQPEGDEEQPRLVDVPVVAVDDMDLRLVGVEAAPQPVGRHRAAGTAAENHDPFPRHLCSPPWSALTAWRALPCRPSGRPRNWAADNYSVE